MARAKPAEGGIRAKALDPLCNFKHETVEVPEWQASVIVRAMSAGDWLDYRQRSSRLVTEAREAAGLEGAAEEGAELEGIDLPAAQIYALVLVRTLFETSGERVFADEDIPTVAAAFSPVHDRLVAKAFDLSAASGEGGPEAAAGNG